MDSKEWMESFINPKMEWANKKVEETIKQKENTYPDAEKFPSAWYQYIDKATLGQDMTVYALLKLQETLERQNGNK